MDAFLAEATHIRRASDSDAPVLLAIYAPLVETTAISFESVVPSADEFAARISQALTDWQWLVAEQNGRGVGYAYGSILRKRAAYQWSV
jgi:L-amino acid N-acyltransferase YncA